MSCNSGKDSKYRIVVSKLICSSSGHLRFRIANLLPHHRSVPKVRLQSPSDLSSNLLPQDRRKKGHRKRSYNPEGHVLYTSLRRASETKYFLQKVHFSRYLYLRKKFRSNQHGFPAGDANSVENIHQDIVIFVVVHCESP